MMQASTAADAERPNVSFIMTMVLAISAGTIVANLYYAQPLDGLIGAALKLPAWAIGLVMTLMQIGYGLGLAFVVPLGDLYENRKLIVLTLLCNAAALFGLAMTLSIPAFFIFALLVGITTTTVQIIIPLAAHLAPAQQRGQVVGNVMSGLLMGIMLSRPIASFLTHYGSWRLVFGLSGAMMIGLALILSVALPAFPRHSELTYGKILRSLGPLFAKTPALRRRGAYHAALFGAFSLFWTAVPLLLAGPGFGLNQQGIGFFALVGAAGALVAPIAGRMADRGFIQPATGGAIVLVLLAFGLVGFGGITHRMSLLVIGAVLLDAGVAFNLILSQRVIYGLAADIRARLNGLFMTMFFVGGACGSALASFSYALGGWAATCVTGAGFAAAALCAYGTEFAPLRRLIMVKLPAAGSEL
jgi:predicted MFS family arabinose efflux permease